MLIQEYGANVGDGYDHEYPKCIWCDWDWIEDQASFASERAVRYARSLIRVKYEKGRREARDG